MKSTHIIEEVTDRFTDHADPGKARQMESYMRMQFAFLGLQSELRRSLTRDYVSGPRKLAMEQVPDLVQALWRKGHREYQYFALDLMMRSASKAPAHWLQLYEDCITSKSWWDTVDGLAIGCVGPLLRREPGLRTTCIDPWMMSDHIWLQRTCLLFQLKYRKHTDTTLLAQSIRQLSTSDEFFIQRAIGWALREYSRTDPSWVEAFVQQCRLAPLSRREALRLMS